MAEGLSGLDGGWRHAPTEVGAARQAVLLQRSNPIPVR